MTRSEAGREVVLTDGMDERRLEEEETKRRRSGGTARGNHREFILLKARLMSKSQRGPQRRQPLRPSSQPRRGMRQGVLAAHFPHLPRCRTPDRPAQRWIWPCLRRARVASGARWLE